SVTIHIAAPTNTPPVATSATLNATEDTAATGTLAATDAEGNSLTYSLVDMSNSHGTVTITNPSTGAFSFTPAANFFGQASFTFRANDGSVNSNVATVTIVVAAVNDAPVATSAALSATEDMPATGTLVATDVDNAGLTYRIIAGPSESQGTVTITNPSTGAYSFIPAPNFNGVASFTF